LRGKILYEAITLLIARFPGESQNSIQTSENNPSLAQPGKRQISYHLAMKSLLIPQFGFIATNNRVQTTAVMCECKQTEQNKKDYETTMRV